MSAGLLFLNGVYAWLNAKLQRFLLKHQFTASDGG
jgi:hypothetical protein